MNQNPQLNQDPPPPPPGMSMADVYFVMFRRKWFVLAGLVLGLAAAAALWKVKTPLFSSTAKVLVMSVRSSSTVMIDPTALQRQPNTGNSNPLLTEGEI